MNTARFELLYRHVAQHLRTGLPSALCYHCPEHSLIDVFHAVQVLGRASGVPAPEQELLNTAALLHDFGYLCRYEHNEIIAARYVTRWLPYFGYTLGECDMIARLIRVTAMPQQPRDSLEQLICDADLDALGRDDYWAQAIRLRHELEAHGQVSDWRHWLEEQHRLLTQHVYFTPAAREMRHAGKQANIRFIEDKINKSSDFSLF